MTSERTPSPRIGDLAPKTMPPAAAGRVNRSADQPRTDLVWTLPGFAPMTRVTTSFGEVHAQALRLRDLVKTKSGNYRPIVWLDRILLEEEFLRRHVDAQPVLIRANALGRGIPKADVMLSPRQPVSAIDNQIAGSTRTAADLLSRPGVFRKAENAITYTMFHCGQPEMVMTERLWVGVSP